MLIKTEDLSYTYSAKSGMLILSDINLEILPGTFTVILGRNGSGKSTLSKHFNAILLPFGGRVFVDGLDTAVDANTLAIRSSVGMVFQNPDNQIVATVVEEDVAFALENLGIEPSEIRRRVDEALKTVGMYEYRRHAPHLLSGGQKQRVAIAGVLAMGPRCVVLDEPTAMLDPRGRADVIAIIEELRARGITVVLITHHVDESVTADRIVVMDSGRIVLDGSPAEVFSDELRLVELGLGVPETVSLLFALRREGLNVPFDAFSVSECVAAIYTLLK